MNFNATKVLVKNRGTPPESFLAELVTWGKDAPDEIFAPNSNPADIYATVKPVLGPWEDLKHRRAVMLEVMRVHAGLESSWNWKEGVDMTNLTSQSNIRGQETGIFQVSFDSEFLNHEAMREFAQKHGIGEVEDFIVKMKTDRRLALEYYARLVRINVRWAGPILRHEVDPWLSRASVSEFQKLLS